MARRNPTTPRTTPAPTSPVTNTISVANNPNQKSTSLTVAIGKIVKDSLQTVIAISIAGILILKLFYVAHWDIFGVLSSHWFSHIKPIFKELKTLEIVAKALAYSAGVDLAYMLLTPGPDEAIEPLILGLASALLFSISSIGTTDIKLALEIGAYVLILAGLFVLKALFITEDATQNSHTLISLLKAKVENWFEAVKNIFKP